MFCDVKLLKQTHTHTHTHTHTEWSESSGSEQSMRERSFFESTMSPTDHTNQVRSLIKSFLHVHVNSFKETRQSKQLRPKTTPFFLKRKNELPRAGFEPATFCVLGERSTN